MDGSLIDLHFDDVLWNELLPRRVADAQKISIEAANEKLYGDRSPGDLLWYSLPHWTELTGVDMVGLHEELAHLLAFRPGAEDFLQTMQSCETTRMVILTNAHTQSYAVKDTVLALSDRVDAWYSSAQLGLPKENPDFWKRLSKIEPYDPTRTMFVDDTTSVLESAQFAGIKHLFTIAQPDMSRPSRKNIRFPAIVNFMDLINNV